MKNKDKVKGLRSVYVFIPTIIWISILYALIIVSTVLLNRSTAEMDQQMENSANCNKEISFLQSASSKMSETATSFAYSPVIIINGVPTTNLDPFNTYIQEFGNDDKRPDNIINVLKSYNLEEDIINRLMVGAEDAKKMVSMQVRAIYIISSMSSVNIPQEKLSILPLYEFTSEENLMTDTEKKDYAYNLLMSRDYLAAKAEMSKNVGPVQEIISKKTESVTKDTRLTIKLMRGFLWGSISLILLSNIILFFLLLKKLVFPITKYAKQINNNERLDSWHGLYEANFLAKAYNNLLDRHKDFEDKLREVAEIDSLTELPNRHCYNEFLRKEIISDKSTCVFLLDINNLKYTNDTYGHAKGDELIKNASSCIKECFLNQEGKNCYRIGGDEFVAIVDNINEDEIEKLIQEFDEKQKQYNVSIAIGYSYCNHVKEIGYEKLIMDADKKMYINKELYKKSLKGDSIYC